MNKFDLINLGGYHKRNGEQGILYTNWQSWKPNQRANSSCGWSTENQSPTSSIQASPQDNKKLSPSGESTPASLILEFSKVYANPLVPSILHTNHKNYWQSKGYSKKTERESHVFISLPNDLPHMCKGCKRKPHHWNLAQTDNIYPERI